MYFVDRKKIEETLRFFEEQYDLMRSHQTWTSPLEKKALERIVHLLVECILDTGNDMIDGFIMRDPGSYDDIMDILVDEKVVPTEEGTQLKKLVSCRKTLVQQYQEVVHHDLLQVISEVEQSLQVFPRRIRTYLEQELGPVSAFK
ncbi:hypothetical protein BK049_12515 [Bacillus xiamenensis]|uniref:DUF86 domain-containing protein n=1 Tax=Bacillus xiamenensis TaxID=1178537 RepID=A0AAC9IIM5_9BACI|nr:MULTISPECIES: DUF86 domain-containing protein [Bacillus]AOZ89441.1 hypothetical protein BK049_12515 [Bacillus xiamenensis]EKF34490.1 hypothetical protein BA1_14911 [Bacillus xiamenensis]MBG9911872.1 hypothetical protein [Bacillus xiamenensis]MCW1835358.1 DUF86 domain-containing protein [Bacillus xiamenensis]MCY9574570.1 DUF86 domain-containing protein [Bacillus xiamenensis]